mgnify:CR=1 FL=1
MFVTTLSDEIWAKNETLTGSIGVYATLPTFENLYDWEDIIVKNELGKISAWDAYWYQAVFMNKGLTLYPNKSHIRNEGFDGTGMHCSSTNDWITPINMSITKRYPNKIKLNKLYMFNTLIFYRYYVLKRYLRFHKSKFSSFKNFNAFTQTRIFRF